MLNSPASQIDVEAVRAEFPALQHFTWFENGGVSITPRCVADAHEQLMRELLERGPMHKVHPQEEYLRRDATIQRLADFFAALPSELALMRGVSEAFQTVLRGLDWKEGDEIIITADEEAALLLPALHLRDEHSVRVVKLPLHEDVEEQLAALRDRLTDQTQLIAVSHVTTDLGWRLPVREICRIAKDHGVLSFVDIAHSAGLFPIDLHDAACDFAGILSYKWMYAPYASGLLYAHEASQDRLAIRYAGGRSEKLLDFERDRYELRSTAERFQYGPWSWPLVHAWGVAAEWLRETGLSAIAARTAELTTRLKDAVRDIPQAHLFTPYAADRSAALVSLRIDGWQGESLANVLRERWNMVVKPLPHTREGLRISIPFFLQEEEIDRLVSAVQSLIDEGPCSVL